MKECRNTKHQIIVHQHGLITHLQWSFHLKEKTAIEHTGDMGKDCIFSVKGITYGSGKAGDNLKMLKLLQFHKLLTLDLSSQSGKTNMWAANKSAISGLRCETSKIMMPKKYKNKKTQLTVSG